MGAMAGYCILPARTSLLRYPDVIVIDHERILSNLFWRLSQWPNNRSQRRLDRSTVVEPVLILPVR